MSASTLHPEHRRRNAMIRTTIAVLAMSFGLATLPATAAQGHQHGRQQAGNAQAESPGGGSACRDGKCASRSPGRAGMGCCCAAMPAKRTCNMGGSQDMQGEDMAAAEMRERIRALEERVDAMQRALAGNPG